MLKAIVKQVQPRTKLLLAQSSGGIAVFADDDGHSQLPRDQQRLVAIIAAEIPSGSTSIAPLVVRR